MEKTKFEEELELKTKDEAAYTRVSKDVSLRFDGPVCWFVSACSSSASLIVVGILYSYGIFFPYILEEFKEAKSTTALVGSLSMGFLGFFGPVSARLTNRFGCRLVIICGGVICASCLFASSFSPNVYVLYVAFGIGFGCGASLIYISAFQTIPLYFERHRSLATALASAGPVSGLIVMSPIIQTLLESFNWRKSFRILAAICLVPSVLGCSIRRKRNQVLQSKQDSTHGENPTGRCHCASLIDMSVFKNPLFMLLSTSAIISALGLTIPIVHLGKYAENVGVPEHRLHWLYFTTGVTSAVTRICTGKLCDTGWISLLHIYQAGLLLFVIIDLALPLATRFEYLMVYSCLYGTGEGLYATPLNCTMLSMFPGEGFGWYVFLVSFSFLTGPVLAGFIADVSGSYHPAFITAGALFFVSFFLPFLLKYIRKSDRKQMELALEMDVELVVLEKVTVL